jgi:hypothetical protein
MHTSASASALSDEALDRLKRGRVGLAINALASLHAADQAGLAQLLDVVRHRGKGEIELARQRRDTALELRDRRLVALPDQLIDRQPIRIREGPE